MDVKEQVVLGDAIDRHWYYRAKAAAMLGLLRAYAVSRILDVGAGSGFFSRKILESTEAISAICVDPAYQREMMEAHGGKTLHFVRHATGAEVDLVLMMDVLEHVNDDKALLETYVATVPSGTLFLITVPAFRWMWSAHDVFLEHKRRYTLSEIDALVDGAGLRRRTSCYYFALVLPLAAVVRKLGNWLRPDQGEPESSLRQHHPLVNRTLWLLCWLELRALRWNRLGGLTVFCIAEKG